MYAQMLREGSGIAANHKEAAKYYKMSADINFSKNIYRMEY